MATKLVKPISREVIIGRDRIPYKVTLEPDSSVTFKKKGSKGKKAEQNVSLGHCLNLAVVFTTLENYKEKMEWYHTQKSAGKRFLKKPKKPAILSFYNPIYKQALTK